jgi:hypothetical protein
MTQRRSRHKQNNAEPKLDRNSAKPRIERAKVSGEPLSRQWSELRASKQSQMLNTNLTTLIERDAPLQTHNGLVLMYGPFQAELLPTQGQGVASWLRDCVRKHGIPSLVRFDYGRRAQVFRRDQFQPWLEPLLSKVPG